MRGIEEVIGPHSDLEMEGVVELLLEQSSPTRLRLALNASRLGPPTSHALRNLWKDSAIQTTVVATSSCLDCSNSQASRTWKELSHAEAPQDTCDRALAKGQA